MRNLAGVEKCDKYIQEELRRAGIHMNVVEQTRSEVPYTITGTLGAFTFTRAWYYWCVSGPMPLEVAKKLDQMPCPYGQRKPWAISYDGGMEGYRYRTHYGARMAAKNFRAAMINEKRHYSQKKGRRTQIIRSKEDARLAALTAHYVVRVAGFAGGTNPEEWAVFRKPDGGRLWIDRDGRQEKSYKDLIARKPHFAIVNDKDQFTKDPTREPEARAYVESYHIDTQEGLNLFAEVVRSLDSTSDVRTFNSAQ